jgi:drug/metabolite transporter (DMT)-like permease
MSAVYILGLSGAFLLAVGFVLQQHVAAQEAPSERGVSAVLLIGLARRPLWLAGIGSMVGGNVLEALALGQGSLTLVEPLEAANLFFALPLGAAWQRSRLGVREYGGAAMMVAGLAGFMLAAGPARVRDATVPAANWVICGAAIVALVAGLTWVAKRFTLGEEATLLAAAAGILFGLQDALTQRSVDDISHGMAAVLTSWQPYALLFVAVVGIALNQNAFKLAPLPASLPALTIAEPLCGISIGVGLFAQHIRVGPGFVAAEILSLGLMVIGVIFVARSPIVTRFEQCKTS